MAEKQQQQQQVARRAPRWMEPFGRSPFRDIWFNRFFEDFPRLISFQEEEWVPRIDFFEKEGKYCLTAELPGMKKDDIDINIDGDMITISGRKQSKREEKEADFYVCESQSGFFSRSLRMPSEVDEKKIDASYKDGILNVTMSPSEEKKRRKIEIH